MTKSILLVGGAFDSNGGRPSGFISRLFLALEPDSKDIVEDCMSTKTIYFGHGNMIDIHNGGTLTGQSINSLEYIMSKAHDYDAVWWFPDIPNSEPKLVGALKDMCPKSVLVISKNNRSDKYEYLDLIARMLKARANLMLEVRGAQPPFTGTILDPLGNAFLQGERDIARIAQALLKRTVELMGFTRMGSASIGPALEVPNTPEVLRFIEIARGYADRFHELVHAANQSRFLGNVSFRCTKAGFPAFRLDDDVFYVSRRNIDKREMATDGFVAARMAPTERVEYFGDAKPSVDAPIQRELFREFPDARFMLHAHVYVTGKVMFTKHRVPCGATDEVHEVVEAVRKLGGFSTEHATKINLAGHGCLILAHKAEHLANLEFCARPLPERA